MSKHKPQPPLQVVGKPRLLRSGSPTAPVCKARLTFIDFNEDGAEKEWTVTCNRAFADKQEICKCGAKRPKESEQDHGYTQSPLKALRGAGEEVSSEYQAKLTAEALERRKQAENEAWIAAKHRLLAVTRELRKRRLKPEVYSELRRIEKRVESLDRKQTA